MQLNNWFSGELVDVPDMKILNNATAETVYGFAGGLPMVIGSIVSTSGTTASISEGYAYFGISTNTDFNNDTGTTYLAAKILPETNIELLSGLCYVFVKPLITPSGDNRYNTVSSIVYVTANENDEGVRLADIDNYTVVASYTRQIPYINNILLQVTTLSATSITDNSMILNADLVALGYDGLVDAGFQYRVVGSPTWVDTSFDEIDRFEPYSKSITSLTANTTYEFRAYVISLTNPGNNAIGLTLTATTLPGPITPDAIINITGTVSSPTNDALNTTNIPSVTNGSVNNATGLMTATANNCVSSSKEYAQTGGDPDFATITTLYGISPYKLTIDPSTTSTSIVLTDAQSGLLTNGSQLIVDDGGDMKIVAAGSVIESTSDNSSAAWTQRTSSFLNTDNILGAVFGNGIYIISGTSGKIATSPDGITWTQRANPFSSISGITNIGFGNGQFIAVSTRGEIATSPDGITWTARTSSFGTTDIQGIAYGNSLWIATGGSGKLATSPDGITWTQRTSSFGTDFINSVAYGASIWVAVGTGNKIATSPDGITWTQRANPFTSSSIIDVAFGDGQFIAVGVSSEIATSPDGITWTLRSSGFGGSAISTIEYGNGIYIAAGGSGKLATSLDGVTWVLRTSSFGTTQISGLAYGNGLWVAVGYAGKLGTSNAGLLYQYTCTSLTSIFGAVPLSNAPTWCAKGGQFYSSSVTSVAGTTSYVTDTIASITRLSDLLTIGLDNRAAPGRYARLRVTCNNADVVFRYSADLF